MAALKSHFDAISASWFPARPLRKLFYTEIRLALLRWAKPSGSYLALPRAWAEESFFLQRETIYARDTTFSLSEKYKSRSD